ncbi:hypothetical protein IW140_004901 [Coemansia sp. RSA 1813]|nr:hypothetical protein EV178_001471 [Coemansia sp. RSA 1646]KAJ1765890.1 hypothetical protein LPJ74_006154 [Coemansia sp. RSA 1843]KAJ2087401.1 hypothetical protein IW138_005018 [Coemansia sp. RSA 986]KAJ2212271.1 hypothetical protein EV179_004822 [Coemansia sp. RSA 487]KAJ2566432.1 hypothetical protein IW140_004901 [Coemansia sp. RSA 1813]
MDRCLLRHCLCTYVLSSNTRALRGTSRTIASRQHIPVASRGDVEYCRQLVLKNDYDNYLVSLFSPKHAREAAWGIRAMNIELVRAGEITTNATAARMRYSYWHDTVNRLYSTNPVQTPISRVVHDSVQQFGISRTWLRRLVSERENALDLNVFKTTADVETYGERAYACMIHPHLEVLGVRDMHADNAARAIGVAMAIMNFTRSLPLLLSRGRCDLPRDLIEKHRVDLDDLFNRPRSTPELQEAVYDFATKGYTRLCGVAEIYLPSSPKPALPALLAAVPVKEWLERLERANFDPFDKRLQRRSLRVLWRLWVASRKGTWLNESNFHK